MNFVPCKADFERNAHRRTQFEVGHSDMNFQSRVFALANIKRRPVFIKKKFFSNNKMGLNWVWLYVFADILD